MVGRLIGGVFCIGLVYERMVGGLDGVGGLSVLLLVGLGGYFASRGVVCCVFWSPAPHRVLSQRPATSQTTSAGPARSPNASPFSRKEGGDNPPHPVLRSG